MKRLFFVALVMLNTIFAFSKIDKEDCVDVKLVLTALTDQKMSDLGEFEHEADKNVQQSKPYLQSPSSTSIYICWSSDIGNPSVKYGLNLDLTEQITPNSITIKDGSESVVWYGKYWQS